MERTPDSAFATLEPRLVIAAPVILPITTTRITCALFLFYPPSTAALAAFYTIHETQPDLIINAGTAGGFKRIGAEIGDAFISTVCAHHDRRIVIPDFVPYGKGTHPSVPTKNLVQVYMIAASSADD